MSKAWAGMRPENKELQNVYSAAGAYNSAVAKLAEGATDNGNVNRSLRGLQTLIGKDVEIHKKRIGDLKVGKGKYKFKPDPPPPRERPAPAAAAAAAVVNQPAAANPAPANNPAPARERPARRARF